jgi:hypothetical protein
MILHIRRNFLNSEIGTAEAGKAQVLGLDEPERPQGTQGLFNNSFPRATAATLSSGPGGHPPILQFH